jgi:hypothetical protein
VSESRIRRYRQRRPDLEAEEPEAAPVETRAPTAEHEAAAARALAAGRPDTLSPGAVLHLQRTAGNAGVAALLRDERETESPEMAIVGHARETGTPTFPGAEPAAQRKVVPEWLAGPARAAWGKVRELFGGESVEVEAARKLQDSLKKARKLIRVGEYVMPEEVAERLGRGGEAIDEVTGPLGRFLDFADAAGDVFAFCDAVDELNELQERGGIAADNKAAARSFDHLFSAAGRLGEHLTPEGAPYKGYFTLLANTGTFFENMERGLRVADWKHMEAAESID